MPENNKKVKPLQENFDDSISTKALDILIHSTIALIIFLCPIFFTGLAAQGMGFEKMALFYFLVLLGVVVWVTKGVFKGELNIKRTPLDLPILAVNVLFAISTLFSVSQKDSLLGSYGSPAKGFVAVVVFSLFYYLVLNNIDAKRIKLYFSSLLSSAVILITFVLLQLNSVFVLPLAFANNINFNPIGSLSGLTIFLVMVLPILTVGAANFKAIFPKKNKMVSLVLKSIILLATIADFLVLGMLNVFTFWPVVIISSVIVLMFFLAKIIKINTRNLIISLGVFIASIIFFVIGNFNIVNLDLPTEVSLSRSSSWNIARASLKDNPIFGSGPSTFYYNFSKYKSGDFNASPLWNVRFESSSGSLFEFLATLGIFGSLAILLLVLISFSLTFLVLLKSQDRELKPIMLGLFASLVSLILLSLLFAQSDTIILLNIIVAVFAISTALFMYPEKFKIIKLSLRSSPKYALALSAIFLSVSAGVVVLFTIGLKMYMADIYARQALLETDTEKRVKNLEKSISLAPYQDRYYLTLANNYMAQANQAVAKKSDSSIINNKLSLAINNGKKAVEISRNNASNNETLALIYENASFYSRGALEWAETLYNDVIKLEPLNPTPYVRLALINMSRANTEKDKEEKKFYLNEAIKYYDKAIVKKADLAAAHYGKAVAYERMDDADMAIEEMQKVNLIAGNNIDYRFELGRLLFNRGISNPRLKQTASEQITQNEIEPQLTEGENEQVENEIALPEDKISVESSQVESEEIERSADLTAAEQVFLGIVAEKPNHANALYSLSILYKRLGEDNNLKATATQLYEIVPDEKTKKLVKEQFSKAF